MKSKISIKVLVSIIPLTVFLSGCGEILKKANIFANQYQSNLQNFSSNISEDIYKSCIRRLQYINLSTKDSLNEEELSEDQRIGLRAETLKDCNDLNKNSQIKVQNANSILIEYITKIGELASGKRSGKDTSFTEFDKNINALSDSISGLKIPIGEGKFFQPPDDFVKTGKSILQVLADTITTAKREHAIKRAILCSDTSFYYYITGNDVTKIDFTKIKSSDDMPEPNGGLIAIYKKGYLPILEIEKTQINGYYRSYFDQLRNSNSTQLAANLIAVKDYNTARNIIEEKKDIGEKYSSILMSTAFSHHKLKQELEGEGKDKITTLELNNLCKNTSKSISYLRNKGESTKFKLTQKQKDNVEKIMSKYINSVNNIIK